MLVGCFKSVGVCLFKHITKKTYEEGVWSQKFNKILIKGS